LDLILTSEHSRELNHEGVQLLRLHYNSQELGQLRRRLNGKGKVQVRFDPEDLGSVWVFDELECSYFNVPCTDEYADGLSLRQHRYILKSRTDTRVAADPVELQEHKVKLIEKLHAAPKLKGVRERTKAARLASPALLSKETGALLVSKSSPLSKAPLELPKGMDGFDVEWGHK
jgi:putative transposase